MKRLISISLVLVLLCSLLPCGVAAASKEISRSYGLGGMTVEYQNDFTGLHITGSTDWFFTADYFVAAMYYDDMDPEALGEMTHADFKKLPVIYDIGAEAMDSGDRFDITIYNLNHKDNKKLKKEKEFVSYLKKQLSDNGVVGKSAETITLTEQKFKVLEITHADYTRYVAYQWRKDGYAVVVQFDSYEIAAENFWQMFNGGEKTASVENLPAYGSYNEKKNTWTDQSMKAVLTLPKDWYVYDRYQATGDYHVIGQEWAEELTEAQWAEVDYIIDFYANSSDGEETIAIGYLNMDAFYPGYDYELFVEEYLFDADVSASKDKVGTVKIGKRSFELYAQKFTETNVKYHLFSQLNEDYAMWVYFWTGSGTDTDYYLKMFR